MQDYNLLWSNDRKERQEDDPIPAIYVEDVE